MIDKELLTEKLDKLERYRVNDIEWFDVTDVYTVLENMPETEQTKDGLTELDRLVSVLTRAGYSKREVKKLIKKLWKETMKCD